MSWNVIEQEKRTNWRIQVTKVYYVILCYYVYLKDNKCKKPGKSSQAVNLKFNHGSPWWSRSSSVSPECPTDSKSSAKTSSRWRSPSGVKVMFTAKSCSWDLSYLALPPNWVIGCHWMSLSDVFTKPHRSEKRIIIKGHWKILKRISPA